MGEYVFDHGWAEAFERAGGRYYPKLQASVPFTPATGRRLLVADGTDADGNRGELKQSPISRKITSCGLLHFCMPLFSFNELARCPEVARLRFEERCSFSKNMGGAPSAAPISVRIRTKVAANRFRSAGFIRSNVDSSRSCATWGAFKRALRPALVRVSSSRRASSLALSRTTNPASASLATTTETEL